MSLRQQRFYGEAALAKLAGMTRARIRFFRRIGLLSGDPTSTAGVTRYSTNDFLRLQQVRVGLAYGLGLEEIRRCLDSGVPLAQWPRRAPAGPLRAYFGFEKRGNSPTTVVSVEWSSEGGRKR